jgi:DNA polymerase-3 subunit gamma/tau
MDQFIVSARKYRPSTFGTVVGQDSITTTLKNAIRNKHLAQAFLFCGPRGVGKTTCARILAKTINCTNLTPDTEGCNTCASCVSFNNGQSLNIFELDAASNNSVDDIRNLVEQVRYPPQTGLFKIYIIDEVHMLSAAAFNAFLKTLEEPPSYAIFILATTEKHKIIPTILSRCQIFDFNRITTDDITRHLASIAANEQVEAESEALHTIALKADGALRDALSIFDQIVSFAGNRITYRDVIENLNILDYEYYFRVTDLVRSGAYPDALLLLDEIISDGFDVHHFIAGLASHFRNLLVCKDERTLTLLETSDATREKYRAQAAQCSPAMLLKYLEITNRCDVEFKSSQNQRLLTELALLKMSSLKSAELTAIPPQATVTETVKKKETPAPAIKSTSNPGHSVSVDSANERMERQTGVSPQAETSVAPAVSTDSAESKKAKPVTTGTISISRKLKPDVTATSDTQPAVPGEMLPVTTEDVLAAIRDFAEQQQQAGKRQLAVSLSKHPPKLLDSMVVEIPVDNMIQSDEILSHKSELLAYLKTRLRNHSLDVQAKVEEPPAGSEKAYTPAEKFRKMAEKNPELDQMRQQFGLEFDY